MNVVLLPPADQELDDAYQYYDEQFPGLGNRFVDEFGNTTELLATTPYGWRLISKNTRRINLTRFPYLILYVVEDDTIFITCIAHQHRNPKYYISRTT